MATALGATRTNADWPMIAAIFDWWFLSSDRRRGGVNRVELPGTSVVHKFRRAKAFCFVKIHLGALPLVRLGFYFARRLFVHTKKMGNTAHAGMDILPVVLRLF